MSTLRAVAPALLIAVAVAACSGGSDFAQPQASAFSAGSCREIAPSVLALGKDVHHMSAKVPSGKQREALKTAQAELRSRQPALSADLAPRVQQLVTSVGILRLRIDTNSYDRSLAADAMTAYDGVVTACT